MGPVNTPPIEQARSIFDQLGYEITTNGANDDFHAERDWKVVHVTALSELTDVDDEESYMLRCFVTYPQIVSSLHRKLSDANPSFEWAIISIDDTNNYQVERAPPTLV